MKLPMLLLKGKLKPVYRWNPGVKAWISQRRPSTRWPWFLYGAQ